MKRTRAERRFFARRAKNRAHRKLKTIFSHDYSSNPKTREWADNPSTIGHAAAVHCVFCSGPCCGNPRRYFGALTIQEQKAEEDFKAQIRFLEEQEAGVAQMRRAQS